MPNWCNNEIIITHDDKKQLKLLNERIKEWTSKDFVENGFGCNWLGNIVGNSGVADYTNDFVTKTGKSLRCRGSLSYSEFNGDAVVIWTETAWVPMIQMWKLICDKYLPGADITFTAEEPGCGVYVTNDPDLEGCYYLDIWGDVPEEFSDEETCYECDEEYIIKFLQRVLKTEETDLKKLLDMKDLNDVDWFTINKWEQCSIDDCD